MDGLIQWASAATLGAVALLMVAGTLTAPLAEPDEARYAEVAREMVTGADWVVPHLSGAVFLDKPPLVFWAESAALRAFGIHDWAARLPVLIGAVLCLFVTWWLARAMLGATVAWLAALLLATAPLFFGMGQVLTLDLPLTLWVTAAMAAIWLGGTRASRGWYRIAHFCCACGVLTKGPIAVVLVWLPAALYMLDRGERGDARRAADPIGIALFALVALPWFGAVEWRQPGFLANFIEHHHFERFVNPWQHREPFWFFLPVLLAGFFPWSLLWIFQPRGSGQALERSLRSPQGLFVAAYAALPLCLFSLSSSKLIPYILPAFPPLAILLGDLYAALFRVHGRRLRLCGGAFLALAGAALLATGVAFFFVTPHWRTPLVRPYLLTGGLALSLLGGLSWYAEVRGHQRSCIALLAAAMTSVLGLMVAGRGLAKSYRALAHEGRAFLAAETTLLSYRHELPAVEFYLCRDVDVIERGDESTLAARWRHSRAPAVFTRSSQLETLLPILPDAAVVAKQFDTVLLALRPNLAGDSAGRPPTVARD